MFSVRYHHQQQVSTGSTHHYLFLLLGRRRREYYSTVRATAYCCLVFARHSRESVKGVNSVAAKRTTKLPTSNNNACLTISDKSVLSAISSLFLCAERVFFLFSFNIYNFEPLKHTFHTRYARVSDIYNFCSQQTCQALVVPVKIEKEISLRGYQHMPPGK